MTDDRFATDSGIELRPVYEPDPDFDPGTPMILALMLMNPTSSMSGVTYGPGPENLTQAR